MKKLKLIFLNLFLFLSIIYFSFLFVLPNMVDLKKYTHVIEDTIYKNTGFGVLLKNPEISTSWRLAVTIGLEKADMFKDKDKFAQVNDLKLTVDLIPLVFKKIKISNVSASKIIVNLNKDIFKTIPAQQEGNSAFTLFEKLPDVYVNYYRISLPDNNKLYSLKGDSLSFSENLFGKLKLKTEGELIYDTSEDIRYNLALSVKKNLQTGDGSQSSAYTYDDAIKIFRELNKYRLNANVNAKLDINELATPDIKGKLDINDFSFVCAGKTYPKSKMNLLFDKNKIGIASNLYTDKTHNIDISGNLSLGKNKNIDLKVKSSELNLKDLFTIGRTLAKSMGNDELDNIEVNGLLSANFNVKSDFKKLHSSGKLSVKNAYLKMKNPILLLNSINADADFSNDNINLKALAKFESYPILVSGTINKNAVADLLITANSLSIKDLIPPEIARENDISGQLSIKATLKGALKTAFPEIRATLSKLDVRNKPTNLRLKNNELTVTSMSKDFDLNISGFNTVATMKDVPTSILVPKFSATYKKDSLEFSKVQIWADNIKGEVSGKISKVSQNPNIDTLRLFIPEQSNVAGFNNSRISINGDVNINGAVNNPQIKGKITLPLVTVQPLSAKVSNATIVASGKALQIHFPYVSIASTVMGIDAQMNNIFNKVPTVDSMKFTSQYFNLDKVMTAMGSNSSSSIPLVIKGGHVEIAKFITGEIVASNVVSKFELKNNIAYLNNLTADAYFGKVAGSMYCNLLKNKVSMNLQGRQLDAKGALSAVSGINQKITGKLDFDSKLSFGGFTQQDIQKSLTGDVKFKMTNFTSNDLGKLDYLIQAQNIVSNSILKSSLNIVKNGLKLKDTGVYQYVTGYVKLNKGLAYLNNVKLAGPYMSLFVSGRYNIPDNTAFLLILGRVSGELINTLGPLGEISISKSLSSIPKIGSFASAFVTNLTTESDITDISKIPDLTVKTHAKTQDFKVVINGRTDRQSSVKSFKWIREDIKPKKSTVAEKTTTNNTTNSTTTTTTPKRTTPRVEGNMNLPDFVKKLPSLIY